MRMKGKKPIFNYKDCWSLDNVLSDIIHAGLVKFKEELVDHPFKGHPIDFCDEAGDSTDTSFQEWIDTIDKMIYSFDRSQEPDIGDYDFTFAIDKLDDVNGIITRTLIEPTDEQEYIRYTADMKIWEERCDEGRELFSKYFHNLWI